MSNPLDRIDEVRAMLREHSLGTRTMGEDEYPLHAWVEDVAHALNSAPHDEYLDSTRRAVEKMRQRGNTNGLAAVANGLLDGVAILRARIAAGS